MALRIIKTKNEADLFLTTNEKIINQVVVRVWKFSEYWWLPLLTPIFFFLPYAENFIVVPILLMLFSLWLSTYIIRQRWRLTLTNKQIVARQLFPRPFTFITRTHHFPHHTIEGLTVGPKAFKTILLIGVFISTNLGVTLLKSAYSTQGYDPPDIIDAILLLLSGMNFLPWTQPLANWVDNLFRSLAEAAGVFIEVLGFIFLLSGLLIVLATVPRRYHLQIRVRHGSDFRLNAGIPRKFWNQCYKELYNIESVKAPKEYKKWRYPWLEGEYKETNADLEQTIYINRLIGLLAIYAGSFRIWQRVRDPEPFFENNFGFWVILALTDVLIATLGVIFSKKKNEMVVTNKRIIFAQEIQDISGAFGRRLYLMSDIRRDDVAGFNIFKLRGMSYRYLLLFLFSAGITIFFFENMDLGVKIVFIFFTIAAGSFILQTYLEFNLKTKGGEIWLMRHQLSNPLTMMRQIVGDENVLLTTLLSNRLEEKEVVDTIQIIRKDDINLEPKIFKDSKFFTNIGEHSIIQSKTARREIELNDLLLKKEKILYEANVSRMVPRRKLNLFIASMLVVGMISVPMLPFILTVNNNINFEFGYIFLTTSITAGLFVIIGLWLRYYSLFKASIVITDKRIFFLDIKDPPFILFLIGIISERRIDETLRDQIHSTYTSRMFSQQQYWRDLIRFNTRFVVHISITGIFIAIFISLINQSTDYFVQYPYFTPLIPFSAIMIQIFSIYAIWYFGNGYIAFVRSLPKRVIHTKGIGSHFIIPFASKEKADNVNATVWKGIIQETQI